MSLFITKSDGTPINITLIQTIFVKDNNLIYYMKNGEKLIEEYKTEAEVTARYEAVKTILTSSSGGGGSTSNVSYNAVSTTGDIIGVITIDNNSINIYNGVDLTEVNTKISNIDTQIESINTQLGDIDTLLDTINGTEV